MTAAVRPGAGAAAAAEERTGRDGRNHGLDEGNGSSSSTVGGLGELFQMEPSSSSDKKNFSGRSSHVSPFYCM